MKSQNQKLNPVSEPYRYKKAMDKISKMLSSDTALPFQSVLLFCDDFGRGLERKILPRRLQ